MVVKGEGLTNFNKTVNMFHYTLSRKCLVTSLEKVYRPSASWRKEDPQMRNPHTRDGTNGNTNVDLKLKSSGLGRHSNGAGDNANKRAKNMAAGGSTFIGS